jgi:Ni/Co efflux regulator RcnB
MLGLRNPHGVQNMKPSNKTLVAVLLAGLAATPVFADKGGNGHGNGHGRGQGQAQTQVQPRGHDRIVQADRVQPRRGGDHVVIADARTYPSCPPGLAKKNPPCVPPGQVNKANRVLIGQPVPSGAVYVVPQPVLSTLPPPPLGYRYAVVGNQVVLVSDANIVVDIVRGLFG